MSELSPEAEALMKQAREAFSPGERQIASVRAALAAKLGASLPAEKLGTTTATKAAGVGTATKLVAIGALVVAAAAGMRMLAATAHGHLAAAVSAVTEPVPAAPGTAAAPSASGAPGAPVAAWASPAPGRPAGASLSPETSTPPRKAPRAEPPRAQVPPSVSVDELQAGKREPRVDGRALLPVPLSHERTPLEPSAPSGTAPTPDPTEAMTSSGPPPPAPPAASAALGGEVSLLRAAHLALDRGDAPTALALLDRYGDAYPNGILEEESLATRALTLCALGRVSAARDVARRLETVAPRSPQLVRVRASCATAAP
jgi:hypothetical protein